MTDNTAEPLGGSCGVIDGMDITEKVIAGLVKNAEEGFPDATFRVSGRPSQADEAFRARKPE